MAHPCPTPNCANEAASGRIACDAHWFQIPTDLRARYIGSINSRNRLTHTRATLAIIEWLQQNF